MKTESLGIILAGVFAPFKEAMRTAAEAIARLTVKPEPLKLSIPAQWFMPIQRHPAAISAPRTRANKLDYRKAKSQRRNWGHWRGRK
jgi:hypothetical protein